MSTLRAQIAFPATLALTLAIALLPAGWRIGWQRELSDLIRFPLKPFTDAGNALATWLRPPRSLADGVPEEARPYVEKLKEEADRALALYHGEHQRVLALEEELMQLQMIPPETLRVAGGKALAHVTTRSPVSPIGPVTVRLKRGWERPIPTSTIAVFGGAHLLGRVVAGASASEATILPLPNPETGYVRARVVPQDDPTRPFEDCALVQLAPTGTGVFAAEIDQTIPVALADVVRLQDESWPPTAQGLVIGYVDAIDVDEQEPLRNTIRVRPRFDVQQVAIVTLIVDADAPIEREPAP